MRGWRTMRRWSAGGSAAGTPSVLAAEAGIQASKKKAAEGRFLLDPRFRGDDVRSARRRRALARHFGWKPLSLMIFSQLREYVFTRCVNAACGW